MDGNKPVVMLEGVRYILEGFHLSELNYLYMRLYNEEERKWMNYFIQKGYNEKDNLFKKLIEKGEFN